MIVKVWCFTSQKRMDMRNVVLVIFLVIMGLDSAHGGQVNEVNTSLNTTGAMTKPMDNASIVSKLDIENQTLEIETKLNELKNTISEADKNRLDTFMPLLVGIIGALLGMIGTYLIQQKRLKHELTLAEERLKHELTVSREKVIFEAQNSIILAQSKRREELYAPLRAHLAQSKEVYDQMCRQLKEVDSGEKYDWFDDPKSTSGKSFFVIGKNGEREPFRLLYKLPDVYGKGYGIDPLVDEILRIGLQMVKTIKKSVGLVLPDQEDLNRTLSEYLAHYVVMKEIRDAVKNNGLYNRYTVGYYPRGLNKLVDEGFQRLTNEISQWEDLIGSLSTELYQKMQIETNARD